MLPVTSWLQGIVTIGANFSNGWKIDIIIKGSNHTSTVEENNKILRYYGVGAQIIKELKIKKMILVSRSKKRIIALKGYGIKITKQEIIK